ncbi:MAG: hypothetical protein LUE12_08025 [Ruminococcus sp.]|nr:hypothetical protein [Ruminococcus sp.]
MRLGDYPDRIFVYKDNLVFGLQYNNSPMLYGEIYSVEDFAARKSQLLIYALILAINILLSILMPIGILAKNTPKDILTEAK